MVDGNKVIETAAGGNLANLVWKLGALTLEAAHDGISKLNGISGEIESLKEELEIIHAILLDMSNEEEQDQRDHLTSHQKKLWKKKIREISYDMEDTIDKFELARKLKHDERSLQEARDPNFTADIAESIKNCFKNIQRLSSCYGMSTDIQRIKDRVSDSEDRHKRLKTGGSCFGSSYDAIRVVAAHADRAGLVGTDAPRKDIIRMLTQEGGTTDLAHRRVVAIVGFGGLGKTTLAKQVFDTIPGEFSCRAFVYVTRKPDIKKVLRDILVGFKADIQDQQMDEHQLIMKLKDHIDGKKYLVVLDDIWDKGAWTILECALFDNSHGSRIIVTTRSNDVAEACCSRNIGHVYKMDPLGNDEAEQLFTTEAFRGKGCPPNLKDVCGKVLKKCGGSPLAILTLSGMLANKVTPSDWETVLKSMSHPDVDVMRRILSFSYLDLPYHLRTCLLYLSIFPEDTEIDRKRLVNKWIAEGFVQSEAGRSRTQIAINYFNELINRNLIQPLYIRYNGQAKACRVHDTILDFIVSKSTDENFITFLGAQDGCLKNKENKIRRLCIHNIQDATELATELADQDLSCIRSLTIFGNTQRTPCSFSLSSFTNLRVLEARDAAVADGRHFIEFDVARLCHLKYLDLHRFVWSIFSQPIHLERLLKGIVKLQHLETLDLGGTYLDQLPADIYKLQQLVRIFIKKGVRMPDGIRQMRALEELETLTISRRFPSLEFLQELALLTMLKSIKIHIEDDQLNLEQELVLVTSLEKLGKCNLRSIIIGSNDNCSYVSHDFVIRDGIFWQAALQKLRKFSMDFGYFTKVPEWMATLNDLEKLVLHVREMEQKGLDVLGELRSLLYLQLEYYEHPNEGLTFRGSQGFQCLKYLKTRDLSDGTLKLTFEAGSMPRLELLEVQICTFSGIEHLKSLTRLDVTICHEGAVGLEAVRAATTNAVSKLPNNPRLIISELELREEEEDEDEEGRGRRRRRRRRREGGGG